MRGRDGIGKCPPASFKLDALSEINAPSPKEGRICLLSRVVIFVTCGAYSTVTLTDMGVITTFDAVPLIVIV
jgi:hypothetical protein